MGDKDRFDRLERRVAELEDMLGLTRANAEPAPLEPATNLELVPAVSATTNYVSPYLDDVVEQATEDPENPVKLVAVSTIVDHPERGRVAPCDRCGELGPILELDGDRHVICHAPTASAKELEAWHSKHPGCDLSAKG